MFNEKISDSGNSVSTKLVASFPIGVVFTKLVAGVRFSYIYSSLDLTMFNNVFGN